MTRAVGARCGSNSEQLAEPVTTDQRLLAPQKHPITHASSGMILGCYRRGTNC